MLLCATLHNETCS